MCNSRAEEFLPLIQKYAHELAMAEGHGRQTPTLAILSLKNSEGLSASSNPSIPGIS